MDKQVALLESLGLIPFNSMRWPAAIGRKQRGAAVCLRTTPAPLFLPPDVPQSVRHQCAPGALVHDGGGEACHAFLFIPGVSIQHREGVEAGLTEADIDSCQPLGQQRFGGGEGL